MRVVAELRALPGVARRKLRARRPAVASWIGPRGAPLEINGSEVQVLSSMNWVGSGYFKAMGTPVLAGREFNGNDLAARSPSSS